MPEHEFLTYVEKDDSFYAYPINMQDVGGRCQTIKRLILNCKQVKIQKNSISKNLEEY